LKFKLWSAVVDGAEEDECLYRYSVDRFLDWVVYNYGFGRAMPTLNMGRIVRI
jgi:hypothetical protein